PPGTNARLWRYLIGATRQFFSLPPFSTSDSGGTKSFINPLGEELIVDNTDKAVAKACEETGATVNDYTAAPIYFSDAGNGGHEWLIEFENRPADMERFIDVLDGTLKAINSDYEAKRHKDIALRRPTVHVLEAGTFTEWLKSKGKLGGQHKVPRLNNERNVLEEILRFIEKH